MRIGELSAFGYSRKNTMMNGGFEIWQRGSSFAAFAGTYFADRFGWYNNTSAVYTVSKSTDVPTVAQAGVKFNSSCKLQCTTAVASITAGAYVEFGTMVEGYIFKGLTGKTGTLSFWVKAHKTGVYCVGFLSTTQDRSYVAEYTVNVADTWEKKTITLTFNASGGTWDYTNGYGLVMYWGIAIGSNYQTTTNTWVTGAYSASSNQVNGADSTSNDYYITGIQLELGYTATEFEYRSFADELYMCQRYFEKSYDWDVAPGTVTEAGNTIVHGTVASDGILVPSVQYKVSKRIVPVRTYYRTTTGAVGCLYQLNGGAWTEGTLVGYSSAGKDAFMEGFTGKTAGDRYAFFYHWTANAE